MSKPVVKLGVAGLGVVGQGVWKHLQADRAALESRLGARIELARAAVRDPAKKRAVRIAKSKLTTDPLSLARDPEIDVVCELMGGTGIAREVTRVALEAGKAVVTANKALICEHGEELFATARRHGGHYLFEASVAGGIPIIKSIREGLVANRFPLIYGILNGTCNYILTRMEREGLSFEAIVEDARRLGYVEADEALDLDGWDTAHKAVILAYLAHGKWVGLEDVHVEGIRQITLDDILLAEELGDFKVKLLAIIRRDFKTDKLSIRVHPTLIHKNRVLARVDEVYNGVSVTGDVVGTTVHIGRGAGQDATASAVISDVADAVLARLGRPPPALADDPAYLPADVRGDGVTLAAEEEVEGRFYFRLTVADKPGVLSKITSILAAEEVSIASVRQQPRPRKTASLILTTHTTNERSIQNVLSALRQYPAVKGRPFLLRIAEFGE